jgi:hypothetical protein
MRFRWTAQVVVAAVTLSCLTTIWSQSAQAQVKLEYKFPEGRKLRYKTTSKTHQVLTIEGMEIPTDDQTTIVSARTVGKRRGDSSLPVHEKIESFRIELKFLGDVNVTYDSSDPEAKIDNDDLAFLGDVFKLVSAAEYTVVLDGQNKVAAVEGTEALLEKADKLQPEARDAIRQELQPETLQTQFEQEHRNLPDVLARPGEPWERTEIGDIDGQSVTFRKKYEYAGTETKGNKTLDKIKGKVIEFKYNLDPQALSEFKVIKSDLKIESSDETILFDREAGCVVESRGKTRIKGSATFSIEDQEVPGELDMTLESQVELQPEAK